MREFRKNKFKKTLKNRQKGGLGLDLGFGKAKSETDIARQKKVNDQYNATLTKYRNIFEITSEGGVKIVLKLISPQLITDLIKAIKDQAEIMSYTKIPSNEEQLTKIVKEALKKFLENTKKQISSASFALNTARMTEETLLTKQREKKILTIEPENERNLVVQFITDLEILKRGTDINKTLPETYTFPLALTNNGDNYGDDAVKEAVVGDRVTSQDDNNNNGNMGNEQNIHPEVVDNRVTSQANYDKNNNMNNLGTSVSSELPSKPIPYSEADLKSVIEELKELKEEIRKVQVQRCDRGGSKKNRTSKRHIKRRTKRHTQYKKRRHTKKRN